MLKTIFVVSFLILGIAFADEIEDAIVKDLDFFMTMEVIENEELAKNWNKFDDEGRRDKDNEKKSN